MRKTLLTLFALLAVASYSQAQKFLDIYHDGKIVSSVKAADVDSLVIGTDNKYRSLDFYQKGKSFHRTETANVDSIKVFNSEDEPLVYLGIMGFNQELYKKEFGILDKNTAKDFNSFVGNLIRKDGTLLYYGVDQALDMLTKGNFPTQVSSVNLVTFTDGLDQGSLMMNSNYTTDEQYLNAVSKRIGSTKVKGLPLTAYSLGLRGSDVTDYTLFQSNLNKLASSTDKAYEVSSMGAVRTRLQDISDQIISISNKQNISMKIPGQSNGTLIRFTFDNLSATNSSLYIEGTFNLSDRSLRNVSYHGFKAESGSTVQGKQDGIFVTFTFTGLQREDSYGLVPTSTIRQYYKSTSASSWQENSEFTPANNTLTTINHSGAVILLVLDCSSSLGSQFSDMLSYAKDFIDRVANNAVEHLERPFNMFNNITEGDLDKWKAPTYADDYRNISDWSKRAQWNLANVHDPTVVLADDGYYYMYQTDASYGNAHVKGGHFHARRSKNLVDWEYLGGTMTNTPSWVKEKLNEIRAKQGLDPISNPQLGYWAPCVRKVKSGLYRMYYCVVVDNYIKSGKVNTDANYDSSWTERAFIGLMETSDPASNKWEDKGFVICSSSDKGKDGWKRASKNDWEAYFYFNAIDPTYVITPEGQHWLIYGSWHSGFAAVQLNGETGKTLKELGDPWATSAAGLATNGYGKRIWTRPNGNRWQGSEAPEIVYHDGYYYLFMAYDGLDIPYNTRIARSKTIDGNYTGNETVLTHPYQFSGSQGWVGISHCAVFDDGQGNWYYASQQRFPTTAGGNAPNAVMMGGVRSIQWLSSGWPVVMPERYAAVPQQAITADEIAGTWEHIDLGYKYGEMKTSTAMEFAADGTITSGPWKGGKWSFNSSTNTLTANGVELKVQRECDWEASPRKHTIVYSGINGAKSYWGKKK